MEVNAETIRQLLSYEKETGKLFWFMRDISWFVDGEQAASHNMKIFNTRFGDKEAFTAKDNNGYKIGRLNKKNYRAHRIAFLIVEGRWPTFIDHEDGDKANNKWENLKEVTHKQNTRNQKLRSTNTSGVMGVSWDKRDQKWLACVKVDGKTMPLGRYDDKNEAVAAREAALASFGYHVNHGKVRGA